MAAWWGTAVVTHTHTLSHTHTLQPPQLLFFLVESVGSTPGLAGVNVGFDPKPAGACVLLFSQRENWFIVALNFLLLSSTLARSGRV